MTQFVAIRRGFYIPTKDTVEFSDFSSSLNVDEIMLDDIDLYDLKMVHDIKYDIYDAEKS